MQYKGGGTKPLPAIARELNVDAILEGTVVQSGRRVRITAQLIRLRMTGIFWTGAYERDVTDVLAVQSEVARAVACQIQVKLTLYGRPRVPPGKSPRTALDLDPSFVNALWWQGVSYAGRGDFAKSIAALAKGASMNDGPLFRALLGHVYARAGNRAKALGIVDELTTMSRQRFVSPIDFAVVSAGLGDADSTFHWLENAYQARAVRISELASMYFDSFCSDPRYADLKKRAGLPA